ncbi:hypothetical protein [Acrocarpospora corrugata]|nr:hypothetical protein [Acrocarpospora corrugata]
MTERDRRSKTGGPPGELLRGAAGVSRVVRALLVAGTVLGALVLVVNVVVICHGNLQIVMVDSTAIPGHGMAANLRLFQRVDIQLLSAYTPEQPFNLVIILDIEYPGYLASWICA